MKETARIFYQNTDDRITINLYFAGIGVLLGIAGERMENTIYIVQLFILSLVLDMELPALGPELPGLHGVPGGGRGGSSISSTRLSVKSC